jgi:hypothetical protein
MAREMTPDETRSFLLEGTRTGKLAIARAGGRPHVTPTWFTLDAPHGAVASSGSLPPPPSRARAPRQRSAKPPLPRATVGKAATATAVGGRYMGADRAEEFGARNAVPGELLVRITPTRVIAKADISE